MVSHSLDAIAGGAGVSSKDDVFTVWDNVEPKTFRKAKGVVDIEGLGLTEGTLRAYFSQWKRSHGIQRRYRRSEKKDE